MTEAMLRIVALLAALALAGIVLATYKHARRWLLIAIGIAAAVEMQVWRVHVATLLAGLLVTCARPAKRHPGPIVPVAILAAALLLAVTVFYGTLVNSPTLALQLIALAATAAALIIWCDRDDVPLLLRGVLIGSSVGSAVAVLQNVRIVPASLYVDSMGFSRVHSIYREPDFLAVFAAIGCILAVRLVERRWLQVLLVAVNGVALAYTFARAAALALVVSAIMTVVLTRLADRERRTRSNKALLVLAVIAAVTVLAVSSSIRMTVEDRLSGALDSSTDISVQARQRQFAGLVNLANSAPWHGYGVSASGRVQGFGEFGVGNSENNVATNWILGWWVDGKFLAVPLIGLFIWLAFAAGRHTGGQILIFSLVNSLFSNEMFHPITWVSLAFAALAVARPGGSDRPRLG
jgi:hypothetical protein